MTFIYMGMGTGMALADCPPPRDYSDLQNTLMQDLQAAPNEAAARPIMLLFWSIWKDAPDLQAQSLLDKGVNQIRFADFEGAVNTLNELVAYCPDYAEGYNQRAFAYYLQNDFANALPDLDKAIELSPLHSAARAGRVLTLIGMGRSELAQSELRLALEINPWLPERRLLAEPPGEDL